MNDQQDKEFGFEEETIFDENDVFNVEDLDVEQDPVPEFGAFASEPGPKKSAAARPAPEAVDDEPLLEQDPEPVVAVPERKSSLSRILILVLLLVLVAAGAFFFLGGEEEPAPVVKLPVPQKQPIAIPKPPAEPAVVTEQMAPMAEKGEPVAAKETPAESNAAVEPAAEKQAVAQQSTDKVESAPTPAKTPVPATAREPAEPKPQVQQVAAPEPVVPVASGPYRVQVGAYLMPSSLHEAEARLQELGLQPQVVTESRTTSITRLFFGRVPAEKAARELAGLKQVAPDAFMIHDGDQVDLYAGSYVSLDKARRYADLLFEKQVRVEERSAEVSLPFYRLSVGPLADHQAAEEVLARLKQKGLDGLIVKHSQKAESSPQ